MPVEPGQEEYERLIRGFTPDHHNSDTQSQSIDIEAVQLHSVRRGHLKLIGCSSAFLLATICGIAALGHPGRGVAEDFGALISRSLVGKAASCKAYGCLDAFQPSQDCQCNHECMEHHSCCGDFAAVCPKVASKAAMAQVVGAAQARQSVTCAASGCGGPYQPGQDCQCTQECADFDNCCSDYETACKAEGASPAHSHGAKGVGGAAHVIGEPKATPPTSRSTTPRPTTMAPTSVPGTTAAAPAGGTHGKHDGEPVSFYIYRAQSEADYPLENVNVADLAGVMWYLHREVVPATPRKYHIDRIKRYKVSVLPTKEFWNVHHSIFGPFFAYDGGRCTGHACSQTYHQYGFIVGCQLVDPKLAAYYSYDRTTWTCDKGTDACRPPVWYSLPGSCPTEGLHNNDIKGNSVHMDVSSGKTAECLARNPGGRCKGKPTGAPDCTYSVEEAGEIMLDELAGIPDYGDFWKHSYERCREQKAQGTFAGECRQNHEYVGELDKGVGCNFWNGRNDKLQCQARMQAAQTLFKNKFPNFPDTLPEPVCDFDTFYKGEFTWPLNHTGATPSPWWDNRLPLTPEEKVVA